MGWARAALLLTTPPSSGDRMFYVCTYVHVCASVSALTGSLLSVNTLQLRFCF